MDDQYGVWCPRCKEYASGWHRSMMEASVAHAAHLEALSDEDFTTFDPRVAHRTVWALLEENGRLRTALEWYAGPDAYDDGGWRASQALARKEGPTP